MASIDGPSCRHGVNAFDPRGCAKCTADYERMKPKTVTKANGHVPLSATFIKEKYLPPNESD